MQRFGFIRAGEEQRALEPLARQLALDCDSTAQPVSQLSGGNQQQVLLARWLLRDPDVTADVMEEICLRMAGSELGFDPGLRVQTKGRRAAPPARVAHGVAKAAGKAR